MLTFRIDSDFYNNARKFIQGSENYGPNIYPDSVGIPTIGYGYAMVVKGKAPNGSPEYLTNQNAIADFAAIGITLTQAALISLNKIAGDLNAGNATTTDVNALEAQIPVVSQAAAQTLFNLTFDRAMGQVKSAFIKYLGSANGALLFAEMIGSTEMIALTDMAFNGGVGLIGPGLSNALWQGNRAEAWYQIRYNHANQLHKRRYEDAAQFSLYDDATGTTTSPAESLSIYQMYSKYANTPLLSDPKGMEDYDNIHAKQITQANLDLAAEGFTNVTVKSLAQELSTAANELINIYGNGKTFDPLHIWVTSPSDTSVNRSHGTGSSNDLIIAGFCDDTLVGGTGNETFVYVVPPAGETAVVNINDSVGKGNGSVYVGSTLLTGGTLVAGKNNTWTDSNGDRYVFDPHTGTLTITQGLLGTDIGNQIIIQNFDLNAAQTSAGYLGIKFRNQIAAAAGTNRADDPFINGGIFTAQTQSATVQTGNAQIVTLYASATGANLIPLSGPVNLVIPAGQDHATFGLIDTSNNSPDTAQLTASLTDANGTLVSLFGDAENDICYATQHEKSAA